MQKDHQLVKHKVNGVHFEVLTKVTSRGIRSHSR